MVCIEKRQVMPNGVEKQGGISHLCHHRTQPITPPRGKANEITQAGAHVGIHAGIEVGFAVRQNLEDKGNGQHADAGHQPTNEHGAWACYGGNILR